MPGTGQSRIWIQRNRAVLGACQPFTGCGGSAIPLPFYLPDPDCNCFGGLHMRKSQFTGIVFCTFALLMKSNVRNTFGIMVTRSDRIIGVT